MTTFEAVYRDGVFRPATPPDLPEGTAVKVTVVAEPLPPRPHDPAAVLELLREIAAMSDPSAPLEHTARDHDKILYGGPGGAR